MPFWAWAFLYAMTAFFTFRLVSSIRTGTAKAGMFRYEKAKEPISYWFFVAVFLFGSVWCWGLLVLIAWHNL